ncbi:unnamed protein product [Leuciscus chuanchicus]
MLNDKAHSEISRHGFRWVSENMFFTISWLTFPQQRIKPPVSNISRLWDQLSIVLELVYQKNPILCIAAPKCRVLRNRKLKRYLSALPYPLLSELEEFKESKPSKLCFHHLRNIKEEMMGEEDPRKRRPEQGEDLNGNDDPGECVCGEGVLAGTRPGGALPVSWTQDQVSQFSQRLLFLVNVK